jgi:hypothetical protein
MAEAVYLLCALTCGACTGLLLRSYRGNRTRLLLWTSVCFGMLAINNIILVVDLVFLPAAVDLSIVRSATAAAAGLVLVIGMTWEAR